MGKTQSKQDLTPEEFDELVQNTEFTSAEIDEWYHKFKEYFPKGRVSQREFKGVYHKLYPQGDADRFCGHIFRVYDVDGNGFISFAEFLTTLHVSARGSAEEKLKATFRMYDIDRNGFITFGEITEILTTIYRAREYSDYKEKSKTDAASIMAQLDADNDKRLSLEEFVNSASTCSLVMDILKGAN